MSASFWADSKRVDFNWFSPIWAVSNPSGKYLRGNGSRKTERMNERKRGRERERESKERKEGEGERIDKIKGTQRDACGPLLCRWVRCLDGAVAFQAPAKRAIISKGNQKRRGTRIFPFPFNFSLSLSIFSPLHLLSFLLAFWTSQPLSCSFFLSSAHLF